MQCMSHDTNGTLGWHQVGTVFTVIQLVADSTIYLVEYSFKNLYHKRSSRTCRTGTAAALLLAGCSGTISG